MRRNAPVPFGKGVTEKGYCSTSPVPYFIWRGTDEKVPERATRQPSTLRLIPRESRYQSWVCERARGELGIGQTTGGLREARGSFASLSRPEPPATPPDAHIRPGARRASRELGTAAAGEAFTSEGAGDRGPVG